jgi:hypothetical protein
MGVVLIHRRELSRDIRHPEFLFPRDHGILRHKGVEVGKMDYLGPMPVQPAG